MHKKECKKRAAELKDEALFKKKPPPIDDCPICMLPIPTNAGIEAQYQACCGKTICAGCMDEILEADNGDLCPFCRTPGPTSHAELVERVKKRAEGDDAEAMNILGGYYSDGMMGLPQDYGKGIELYTRAANLGCTRAYGNVGYSYQNGLGVERDEKKATHYYELAAMGGDAGARANLGVTEAYAGNFDRAVKHWMISAGAGDDHSLNSIRECFLHGDATKDDFEKALRAHKKAKDETRSDQRDAAE
jgi:TPR repeat protein